MAHTLRGMSTVSFWADDVKAARDWYNKFLNMEPYFERPDSANPAYIEYRIGDFQDELGIIDRNFQPKAAKKGPGGAVLYWHVDNLEDTHKRLLEMGATEYEPITKREAGFVTAAVTDPFGNIIGLMYSPHFLEVLQGKQW